MKDTACLIPLTQGKFAIVDALDYEWVNQWKWCAAKHGDRFYAVRKGRKHERGNVLMHRAIAARAGFPESPELDHSDRNGLNNSRSNIRPCSRSQNSVNTIKRSLASSKFKGVSWDKVYRKWKAQIEVNRKGINLGRFDDEIEAHEAYSEAAARYFGEFARP